MTEQPAPAESRPPRRINVAASPDVMAAITRVIEKESVTLTEAVRRLITYGDAVYRTVKDDGATVVLRCGDVDRQVVLL